jgi:hypothetical protein
MRTYEFQATDAKGTVVGPATSAGATCYDRRSQVLGTYLDYTVTADNRTGYQSLVPSQRFPDSFHCTCFSSESNTLPRVLNLRGINIYLPVTYSTLTH